MKLHHLFEPLLLAVMTACLFSGGPLFAQQSPPVEIEGTWTYRSFVNNPDLSATFDSLRFGAGTLTFDAPDNGKLRGQLGFGGAASLELNGTVAGTDPVKIRFQGKGGPPPQAGPWVYDYVGFVVPNWPGGIGQQPAIVGSIIRTQAHSAGQAPAGFVASWIAVRQNTGTASGSDDNEITGPERLAAVLGSAGTQSEEKEAAARLRAEWEAFYRNSIKRAAPAAARLPALESLAPLTAPQRVDVLEAAREALPPLDTIRSSGGFLDAELVVDFSVNKIGSDTVRLRSYNGGLVGPTLRAKPGDTLRIRLVNRLPQESTHMGDHNQMHGWNTTNLHTHGLHVSPSGNSDNVFLEVGPGETQDYVIEIPADHPAGTFWYHAHKHGSTAAHVSSGMSGALIIEGGVDTVPEIAAATEQIFVFQQIPYILETQPSGEEVGVVEKRYVDQIFGPGRWDPLERFTTINGGVQPVIEMQPGEVQRWRFIHAGVREPLILRLTRNDGGVLSNDVDFHEIAVDGLSFGKRKNESRIELHPGYRSDTLIKAPAAPGEYVLSDERVDGPRKFLARIVVSGAARNMALPTNADLAPHKGIKESLVGEPAGNQEAQYAITFAPSGGVQFTINGRPFDPNSVRELKLGTVDEWTLSTAGQPFAVDHPFHIHVNPFEVISMVPPGGQNVLNEPVWRDTLLIPHGWTIKMRTRYRVFTGSFVQHCHILDHEDQGMMEKISIVDTDEASQKRNSEQIGNRAASNTRLESGRSDATILVFFRGFGCSHCNQQIDKFASDAAKFSDLTIELIAISSDSGDQEKAESGKYPFVVRLDPELRRFEEFGCVSNGEALHGVVILDRSGKVRWRKTGQEPFMDIAKVLEEGRRIAKESRPSQPVQHGAQVATGR